jgi:hypothetical protein
VRSEGSELRWIDLFAELLEPDRVGLTRGREEDAECLWFFTKVNDVRIELMFSAEDWEGPVRLETIAEVQLPLPREMTRVLELINGFSSRADVAVFTDHPNTVTLARVVFLPAFVVVNDSVVDVASILLFSLVKSAESFIDEFYAAKLLPERLN